VILTRTGPQLISRRRLLIGAVIAIAVGALLMAAIPGGTAGAARTARGGSLPVPHPTVAGFFTGPAAGTAAPGPGVCFGTARCFTPAGMQASFNLGPLYAQGLNGAGETIAIVDSFGYPTVAADLETFSQSYGLPMMCGMPGVTCTPGMPTFSVLQFGNRQVKAPPENKSPGQEASNAWSLEVALDTQWAHTVAPEANILLVTTSTAETLGVQGFPNMMNAEQDVVDNHLADVVSQSFAAAEESFGSTASLMNLRHAFISGTAAGITFFAASGDAGTANVSKEPVGKGGSLIPYPTVQWPASDPLVVAAGGTTLCTDPATGTTVDDTDPPADCQNNPGQKDVGWQGSGGGFSSVFAKPSWQDNLPAGSTPISSGRGVPDVSWDASCGSLVWVLDTAPGFGNWFGVCGTSAASPQLAAMTSIADQAAGHDLGDIHQTLYSLASGPNYGTYFYDVTAGNNQTNASVPGYNATTGWDPITGLGTPDAATLVPALAAG
jgi:subtilase family serine protease